MQKIKNSHVSSLNACDYKQKQGGKESDVRKSEKKCKKCLRIIKSVKQQ